MMNRVFRTSVPVLMATIGVLFVGRPVQAQIESRLGFLGGVNLVNQGGDMEEFGDEMASGLAHELGGFWSSEKKASVGFGVGAYLLMNFTTALGIQVEGQYVRRGFRLDLSGNYEGIDISETATFKLDYLEIPVLLRVSPSPGAAVQPLLMVGPVFGIKRGAELGVAVEAGGQSAESSVDISEGYNDTTVGLMGAFGLAGPMGSNSRWVLQARYYAGLTNAIDDANVEAKSSDVGIFAGMEFGLGR